MCHIWEKSSKKITLFVFLLALITSCKQSCFDVITHNNVGYWSRYWTEDNPVGIIEAYSKKDSTVKALDNYWNYTFGNTLGDIHGVKFRISNDTLFYYVKIKETGLVIMWDTIPIVSYSKNKIVVSNNKGAIAIWHRLPANVSGGRVSRGRGI